MADKVYIKELLSRGIPQGQVAALAGVSPSFISQLISQTEFAEEVERERAKRAIDNGIRELRAQKIYDGYLDLEESLVESMKRDIKSGALKSVERARILAIVGMKKPPAPSVQLGNGAVPTGPIVTINLPQQLAQEFIINGKKDIIGLGKDNFLPLSLTSLQAATKEEEKKEGQEEEAAINYSASLTQSAALTQREQERTQQEISLVKSLFAPSPPATGAC